jgi:Flp pilus assembly pilin Flp
MLMGMVRRIWTVLRDEKGIETGEWIAILALVLAIAFIVYGAGGGGALQTGLAGVVTQITTALAGLNP